jgi:methylmalonyl-CoA epimerase
VIYYVLTIGTHKVIKIEGRIMATKVSFVGILVRDIEAAAEIYTEVLGLKPWEHGTVELPGARALLLQAGDCYIELLQPTVGPEAAVGGDLARRLEKYGEGFCRLGLWVDGLDAEIKRLREIGLPVIDPGEFGGAAEEMGARMAFIHPKATHGVLIELDQQAP